MLCLADGTKNHPQILCLCSNNLAAAQTWQKCVSMAQFTNLRVGFTAPNATTKPHPDTQILIGTRGEIISHLQLIETKYLSHIFFDDFDTTITKKMISTEIIGKLHNSLHFCGFSTTSNRLAEEKIPQALTVGLSQRKQLLENIKHFFIRNSSHHFLLIRKMLSVFPTLEQPIQVIVFCNVRGQKLMK